jgi:hypothetical protein
MGLGNTLRTLFHQIFHHRSKAHCHDPGKGSDDKKELLRSAAPKAPVKSNPVPAPLHQKATPSPPSSPGPRPDPPAMSPAVPPPDYCSLLPEGFITARDHVSTVPQNPATPLRTPRHDNPIQASTRIPAPDPKDFTRMIREDMAYCSPRISVRHQEPAAPLAPLPAADFGLQGIT